MEILLLEIGIGDNFILGLQEMEELREVGLLIIGFELRGFGLGRELGREGDFFVDFLFFGPFFLEIDGIGAMELLGESEKRGGKEGILEKGIGDLIGLVFRGAAGGLLLGRLGRERIKVGEVQARPL